MNPEYKNKWMHLLRSGKYDQIRGQLYEGKNKYSAVGVLCRVYLNINFRGCFDVDGSFTDAQDNTRRAGAPQDVLIKAQLVKEGPGIQLDTNPALTVVALNDGLKGYEPHSFEAIAEYVDEFL